jgi:hypothetical protein
MPLRDLLVFNNVTYDRRCLLLKWYAATVIFEHAECGYIFHLNEPKDNLHVLFYFAIW